jgi:PAS domain S-box-containing protein
MGQAGNSARVLVVDDDAPSRKLLRTLLGYSGYRVLEANDGAEALERVRDDRPNLVISDILMPNMDGYEFVRRLRSEREVGDTPVIFYSAIYRQKEASELAGAYGVRHILTKPCKPEKILGIVRSALEIVAHRVVAPSSEEFERKHLRLVTDKVLEKAAELEAARLRLAKLLELGQRLPAEDNPEQILKTACRAAREIVDSRSAVAGLLHQGSPPQFFVSGPGPEVAVCSELPWADRAGVDKLLAACRPMRVRDSSASADAPGRAWMGVPISSASRLYGVLYFVEKLGAEDFSPEDECTAATIASLIALNYENAVRRVELERELRRRTQAEREIQERAHLAELVSEIGQALTQGETLRGTLQQCAESLVRHLGAAFARIWTLNSHDNVLELQASAGMYTRTDGAHGRVPVGKFKIGLIAQERRPHLTNNVAGDPCVGDREWARREGMVAFAGYPLVAGDRLVGVMALFARQPLMEPSLAAMASVANPIAVDVDRWRALEEVQADAERYRLLFDLNPQPISVVDCETLHFLAVNEAAVRQYGYSREEFLAMTLADMRPPEDVPALLSHMEQISSTMDYAGVWTHRRKDGSLVHVEVYSAALPFGRRPARIVLWVDVTERERSQKKFRALVESAPDALVIVNQEGNIVLINSQMEKLFGYACSELAGQPSRCSCRNASVTIM